MLSQILQAVWPGLLMITIGLFVVGIGVLWATLKQDATDDAQSESAPTDAYLESGEQVFELDGIASGDDGIRLTVGRDPNSDIVITTRFPEYDTASRQHAEIRWTDQGWVVQDLDSQNGTLVNGRPVDEAILHGGNVVSFGDVRFFFKENGQTGEEEVPDWLS
jgi:pSer/pThr/pTyr-binding forkhead associated (FHA) protein